MRLINKSIVGNLYLESSAVGSNTSVLTSSAISIVDVLIVRETSVVSSILLSSGVSIVMPGVFFEFSLVFSLVFSWISMIGVAISLLELSFSLFTTLVVAY